MTVAAGTLTDAPRSLIKEIKDLEQLLTIDTAKLKEITNHFINELTKGMCSTTAQRLSAKEQDIMLTIDRSECGGRQYCKLGLRPHSRTTLIIC